MSQSIYLVTYLTGEYSDRSDHNYKAYVSKELATEAVSKLQSYCEWYIESLSRLTDALYPWMNNYKANNPSPPQPPILGKKTSNPEYNALSQKEWLQVLQKFHKEAEPYRTAIDQYHKAFRDAVNEMESIWWNNNFLNLPSELMPFKGFINAARAHSILVEQIDFIVE